MKHFLVFILVLALFLAGCVQMVDSTTTFSVEGFEDFYALSTAADKSGYIHEGKIEFAKLGNLYVCPFIKEVNHEECALFFYVYSLEDGINETVTIQDVVLSAKNGEVVVYSETEPCALKFKKEEGSIQLGNFPGKVFKVTNDWFGDGIILNLSFRAEVEGNDASEKTFSYDIKIIRNKRPKSPT